MVYSDLVFLKNHNNGNIRGIDRCSKGDSAFGKKEIQHVKSISVQVIEWHLDDKYVVSVFTFVKEKLSRLDDKSI